MRCSGSCSRAAAATCSSSARRLAPNFPERAGWFPKRAVRAQQNHGERCSRVALKERAQQSAAEPGVAQAGWSSSGSRARCCSYPTNPPHHPRCHNHDSRTSPSVTQRKKGGATVTKCLDKLFSWRPVENFFSVNSAALSQVVTRVSSSPPPITWNPLAWSLCQFLRPSLFPAVPHHSEPSLWIHLNGAELVPTLSSLK